MSLVETSIRKPVFAWMLMAALIIFGFLNFKRMGVSQMPDVDSPIVNINITYDGAAPEVVELDVVDPVEGALLSIEGVKSLDSTARSGSANITAEFDLDKDIDVAVQEVQGKLSQIQRALPRGIDAPTVSKSNPEDQPIMWLSVSSKTLKLPELNALVRDSIKGYFSTVPGVSDVFLAGYVEPNVRVWVDPKKLNQFSLTVDDLVNAIQTESVELPSGKVEEGANEFNIRTMGEASSMDDFKQISIQRRGGAPNFIPLKLGDVARVEFGLADIRRKARVMGDLAVGLGIRKQRNSNAVDVAKLVKLKLDEVQKILPEGTQIGINFDSTKFIKESVDELVFTLVLSALLTALACWLFLGSWTSTLNVILSIPTSVLGTFIVLNAFGFTLNYFTLLGLSLAIGIVVDDAIMVLENIFRYQEMGQDRKSAALNGAREITFSAMAATAAIIAIFLPVAFMEGIVGKYFMQFGVTISVAVALSLLEALTITPMRCAEFVGATHRTTRIGLAVEKVLEKWGKGYERILPKLLKHRWKTIAASILFFAASLSLFIPLKKEFVPSQDQGSLFIRLRMPEGTNLDTTDQKMKEAESLISARPEVQRYFGSTGGFGGGDVNSGIIFVTLKDLKDRKLSQQQISQELRDSFKKIETAKLTIMDMSGGGFGGRRGFPVEFTLQGPEWGPMIEATQKVMKELEKSGMVADVDSNFRGDSQEVHIVPDREKALVRGVSISSIGATINSLMGGVLAGKYSQGGRRYDIRVKIESGLDIFGSHLKDVLVRNNRGEMIPLADVTRVERKPALLSINRLDRFRSIDIYGNLPPKVSLDQAMAKVREVTSQVLPKDVRMITSGSSKQYKDSMSGLWISLLLGILVSYMILGAQFNSFVHPLTVLVALPFSLSGAVIALFIAGKSINLFSMIGILLLMGIVKKNSIMLVDFANQARDKEGLDRDQAMTKAGPIRLRPILMTSFATVAGALPPALSIGPGAESRVPMALAIVGGVIVSTILTLFVVPCVYSVLGRRKAPPVSAQPT